MQETERRGLGGVDKLLIGCGIGCAGLILVAVLGVAFGTVWFFTPGEQVATEVIVDEASLGAVRLNELAEDPGTQELLTRVLQHIDQAGREQQREQLPPALRWLSDFQAQQSNTAGINMLIPKEMTVAFEEAEDGAGVDFVVAANPRTMVRMFKTMIGFASRGDQSGNVRSDYRGHAAYALEDGAHLAFVRSTLMFASSRRALERAIDRIARDPIETGDTAATDAGTSPASTSIPRGEWDVEGALGNRQGLVDGLLAELLASGDASQPGDPPPSGEDLQLGFGLDVVSGDEIAGQAQLECGDRRAAEQWLDSIEQRFQALRAEASERGLELELEARVDGDRVLAELQLTGVADLIAEAFAPEVPEESDEEGE